MILNKVIGMNTNNIEWGINGQKLKDSILFILEQRKSYQHSSCHQSFSTGGDNAQTTRSR